MIWYRLHLICWICIILLLFPSNNAKVVEKRSTCKPDRQLRSCANMVRKNVHKLTTHMKKSILNNLKNKTHQEFMNVCTQHNICYIQLLLCINRKLHKKKWKHCLPKGDRKKIKTTMQYLRRIRHKPEEFNITVYNNYRHKNGRKTI
ncbi:hypothetical protein MN116_002758 [Schistosoma mekongi]|uniref:Saposin B-type domain-containing protein n=1 Tax=Schistosoma mekongi TaxID=38744 RepID=A0AAE2D6M9_SCHME|nr:hypothetical protein MN116_002758 [Schistosoma mekongi]